MRLRDRKRLRDLQDEIRPQALRFALIMVDRSDVAIRITRRAVRDVLGDPSVIPPSPRAAVLEAVRRRVSSEGSHSGHASSAEERLSRAVTELCDGQGLSHRVVARSLGTSPEEVARLHELALRDAGVDRVSVPRCSGWSLVRRYDDLAPVELVAADRHIELCRDCCDAHAARLLARARLRKAIPIGGAGLVAGGAAGLISVLGTAVVGVVAVGALATTSDDVDIARTFVLRDAAVAAIEPVTVAPGSIVADEAEAASVPTRDGIAETVADLAPIAAAALLFADADGELLDPSVPLGTLAPTAESVVEDATNAPAPVLPETSVAPDIAAAPTTALPVLSPPAPAAPGVTLPDATAPLPPLPGTSPPDVTGPVLTDPVLTVPAITVPAVPEPEVPATEPLLGPVLGPVHDPPPDPLRSVLLVS